MRAIRALAAAGAAVALAGLLLPSLRGAEPGSAGVPWIWGTLQQWEQWVVAGALAIVVVGAAGALRKPALGAVAAAAAAGTAVPVGRSWSMAAGAADELSAAPGWGYPVAIIGLALVVGAGIAAAARGRSAGVAAAAGEPATTAGGGDVTEGSRYLDVVIEERSGGE